jgi:hypothetical protein
MSAKSDYLEEKILDHILGKAARNYTSPANLFVALSTANPTDTGGALAEPSGNGYARQAVSFNAAGADGATENTAQLTFGPCTTTSWGTITHFAIFDASSAGNMLYYGALTASKTIDVSDSLVVAAGDLDIAET